MDVYFLCVTYIYTSNDELKFYLINVLLPLAEKFLGNKMQSPVLAANAIFSQTTKQGRLREGAGSEEVGRLDM